MGSASERDSSGGASIGSSWFNLGIWFNLGFGRVATGLP